MKQKAIIFLLLLLGSGSLLRAQDTTAILLKQIELKSDTIQIDSLTIIPSTLDIRFENGEKLDSNLYQFDVTKSQLILNPSVRKKHKSISVNYQSFPYDLAKIIAHKDINELQKKDERGNVPPLIYRTSNSKQQDLFGLSDFSKRGSISRAVSVGNSQDLSVASNLNLQIAGDITPDLRLTASITDNNIPIQPDGNTQQIQDFDKVFIMLSHENGKLIAGDYEIKKPNSYFLNYHKKAQGAYADVNFALAKKEYSPRIRAYGGIALSRGKFARNQITGIEGSQGPYKLHGSNFERYIVVLSGTERVYIDGKLLTRGQNYDYVIDYNTAEITFMPKILITKDKR
ncbi:MAG: hypothetical protein DSY76_05755, partial [Bacteroidetes bacterium]